MKKFLKQFATVLILINAALMISLAINAPAFAAPTDFIKGIGEHADQLNDFDATGQHPDATSDAFAEGIGSVTSPVFFILDFFRLIISTIAGAMIVLSGVKMISSTQDDVLDNSKKHLMWGVLGLVLVQLADVVVKQMFFGEQGEAFQDQGTADFFAEQTVSQVRGIIGFIEFFLGAIAVLVIVVRGFTVIAGGGEEEALTNAKTHIGYAVAGLVVIGLSEFVVLEFIFPEKGTQLPNVSAGQKVIKDLTNFISSFIAIFSFLTLFYAGYRYVASAGEDEVNEEVKKLVKNAIIALLLALGAFAAVNTFVQFDPGTDPVTAQHELIDEKELTIIT